MNHYLLDTSVIIDILRKNDKKDFFLDSLREMKISIVTAGEIYQGAKDKNDLKLCRDFIQKFCTIIPLDHQISQSSLILVEKYSLSSGMKIIDALIAASALTSNLILVTANVKHFKSIKNLKLKKWPV